MTSEDETGTVIRRRVVLHFAGFEPLDAEAHRKRYDRSAKQASGIWDCRFSIGPLAPAGRYFDVDADGSGWRTQSRVHMFDLAEPVAAYRARPLPVRLASGYAAAASVVLEGGLFRYLRHAWRFALFFIFPFLLVTAALALSIVMAVLPFVLGLGALHLVWSFPAAYAFFRYAFLPFSDRYHTLHLFSDWQMAAALAHDGAGLENILKKFERDIRVALQDPADELLITSHSIGSNLAIHVIGKMLEENPALFAGRAVRFVTLGGAVLQCALLDSARRLRTRVGLIAAVDGLFWLDIQCLTDVVNFYRSQTFTLCGHRDIPPATLRLIRFKHMLDPDHYRRIKRDMLRVHRQYVLGSDRRSGFDFTLMTAGPLPASSFAGSSLDPLAPFGMEPDRDKAGTQASNGA